MLKLTNPGLRRSNVVLDSFGGCVSDAPKEFSRTPEMSFSKMASEPRMFFEKAKSTISFKQLKSHANTHSWGYFNEQMDVVNTNVKFINLESPSVSDLSQEELAIHSKSVELERVFSIFNFPDKMEGILSKAVFSGFQIHFSSPKSATRNRAHANFAFSFEEPSISAPHIKNLKKLNLMENGDSSLL